MSEAVQHLRTFIEHAPAAIAMFDRDMRYLSASNRWARDYRLGEPDLRGQSHYEVFPEISESWRQVHARALAGEVLRADADLFVRTDGSTQWLRWEVRPWHDAHGHVGGILIYSEDISDLKAAESAWRAGEERYQATVSAALDAIVSVDETGQIVLFNDAAEATFGVLRGEALGTSIDQFLPERFRRGHIASIQAFGDMDGTSRRMGRTRIVTALRKSGDEFPVEASVSHGSTASGKIYTAILRDVSERVRAEQALQRTQEELRQVKRESDSAREQERRRIARELHDDIAHSLLVLQLDLESVRDALAPEQIELREKIEAMRAWASGAINATRRIAADLRPLVLDDLGFVPAAEALLDQFTRRSGVRHDFYLDPAMLELTDPHSTAVFRIMQESLTNVFKHAQASSVEVKVRARDGEIALEVRDNGRGFTPGSPRQPGSLGLSGVRERAHMLGGDVQIDSAPGCGTTVKVRVPWQVPDESWHHV